MNWFKNIKVFDGKPANRIAYADKIFNEVETVDIIKKTH